MIEEIEIDGFRSLIGFSIKLQPGLNVVVGANGTGKSNFITFLDFLGTLVDQGLNAAIAVAQGAGSLFSKEKVFEGKATELSFTLKGKLRPLQEGETSFLPFNDEDLRNLSGTYSYRCTISYLSKVPAVFISSESLSVAQTGQEQVSVGRSTSRDDTGFKTQVEVLPETGKFTKALFRFMQRDTKQTINQYLAARIAPERSFLPYLASESPAFGLVYSDLVRYRSVNIDPTVARKSTPVGSVTTLQANGEGLAGALYELKKGTYFPGRNYHRYSPHRNTGKGVFESIISWCKEVNPAIDGVDVELDVMEAQLRPFMNFRHCELLPEKYPFNRISDGTVKWLALTTVLFAEPSLSLIEEPENFLHPFMQESFVTLCRQAINLDPQRTLIISTHSPTLLDCCRPGELTLFELVDGQTHAAKIANRDELERKLRESRFGLGHYYRIGALYGENSSDS